MQHYRYISLLMLAAVAVGCSDGDEFNIAPENKVNPGEMVIQMGRSLAGDADPDLVANTRLYQFHADTDTTGKGTYVAKPQLTKLDNNKLTFQLGEGWWDFSMVWCRDAGVTDSVMAPLYGHRAAECPMWEQRAINNTLISAPEIYTALIDRFKFSGKWVIDPLTHIDHWQPDEDYEVDANYVRNVARLEVHFTSSEDLDPAQPQNITISNVPSTLNWRGELYPNRHNPEISAAPLRGEFQLETIGENQTQGINQLNYTIPAHRGTDYANGAAAIDTTTSLLRLNVDLICLDGTHVVKNNIILDKAPRVNGIYRIDVSYNKRKLNVGTTVLPWTDENASAAIGDATIITDKIKVELAYRDTLHIESPHPVTVSKAGDASWITLRKLAENVYEVEADINTYEVGHPRTSYLILRDGNLERRVPVTQRPEKGTIDVVVAHPDGSYETSKRMWISPPHNKKAVNVHTTGGGWKILPNLRVQSVSGGAGESNDVMLTRVSDDQIDFSDFNTAYGCERVVFMNTQTLDTAAIWIDNLFIGLTDDIVELEQPEGATYKDITTDLIQVAGGDRSIQVTKWPDFVDSNNSWYDKNTGLFHFRSLSNPSGDDRADIIKIGHSQDPDYTVELWLDQVIMVNTPEFDYFVVKFTWSAKDVDIKVGFTGNTNSQLYHGQTYSMPFVSNFNDKWCGWSQNSANGFSVQLIDGTTKPCLTWGGDATGGQGETVFFNAKELNSFPYPGMRMTGLTATQQAKMIPRVMTLQCNAGWYTSGGSGPITCSVYFYRDGTMVQSGTNFNNSGGTLVQQKTFSVNTSKSYKSPVTFCTVEYDRKRHTARFTDGTGG